MSAERRKSKRERIGDALAELESIVKQHFPDATFSIERSADDGRDWELMATTQASFDDVMDVVMDRVLEMHDEGLWVHVMPMPTPEQNARELEALKRRLGYATPQPANGDSTHAEPSAKEAVG